MFDNLILCMLHGMTCLLLEAVSANSTWAAGCALAAQLCRTSTRAEWGAPLILGVTDLPPGTY